MKNSRELKKEFLRIKERYLSKILTQETTDCIWHEYKELFYDFNLDELKFSILLKDCPDKKIIFNPSGEIIFNPIREIDKLAIKGILSL